MVQNDFDAELQDVPDGNKEEDNDDDDDGKSDAEDELERQMGDLADDNKDVRVVARLVRPTPRERTVGSVVVPDWSLFIAVAGRGREAVE